MKNLLGLLFRNKCFILTLALISFSALSAYCYETVILHKPDRNWIAFSYENKQEEGEVIAKFIPKYDNKSDWNEMLTFHSFKEAKKGGVTADDMIQTVMSDITQKYKRVEKTTVKTDPDNAIMTWCGYGGQARPTCGVVRVTTGIESLISIEYAMRDTNNFEPRKKFHIKLFEEGVVYYSYFRWDGMMNKALCVEL